MESFTPTRDNVDNSGLRGTDHRPLHLCTAVRPISIPGDFVKGINMQFVKVWVRIRVLGKGHLYSCDGSINKIFKQHVLPSGQHLYRDERRD